MDDRAVAMMSGSELLSAHDVLQEQIVELQARQSQVVARMDEMGYAKEIGAHDTARLLATRYRLDLTEAHRRARLAINLHKYPAVTAALPTPGNVIPDDGVVLDLGQAGAIVSALEQLPSSANVPVDDLRAAEEQLVEAARHMSPSELRSMGVQVRNILDTDGPEPREDAARQRENVWVKKDDGGVKFGGYLAAENGGALETVLQHGAKPHKTPDGAPDPRSRGKRQADALVDALSIALGSGDLSARGGIKPHIAVTIDLNDLLEAGKNATGDLAFGDGLSASAIRRLACDAGIIAVVLGSDSQPLDVGREHRFVTAGLRNALNQRDKGCVVCHAPPIYCDAHHLVSWLDGGITSLGNLVSLCRVDHTALHDGHWAITITNNQVKVTRPTWADPQPRRHRKPAPPSTTPATAHHPAATDADTCTPPTTASPMPSAANDTGASTPTTPTRAWPYPNDVTWITPEEAAAFDPWGDNTADTSAANPTNLATITPTNLTTITPTPNPARSDTPPNIQNTGTIDPWADSA